MLMIRRVDAEQVSDPELIAGQFNKGGVITLVLDMAVTDNVRACPPPTDALAPQPHTRTLFPSQTPQSASWLLTLTLSHSIHTS